MTEFKTYNAENPISKALGNFNNMLTNLDETSKKKLEAIGKLSLDEQIAALNTNFSKFDETTQAKITTINNMSRKDAQAFTTKLLASSVTAIALVFGTACSSTTELPPTNPVVEKPAETLSQVICGGVAINFVQNEDGTESCKVESLEKYLENGRLSIEMTNSNATMSISQLGNGDYVVNANHGPDLYIEVNGIITQPNTPTVIAELTTLKIVRPNSTFNLGELTPNTEIEIVDNSGPKDELIINDNGVDINTISVTKTDDEGVSAGSN